MLYLICLALLVPLLSFLILMLTASHLSRRSVSFIACSSIGISFISFMSLLSYYISMDLEANTFTLFNWIALAGMQADIILHVDHLTLLMTLIITGVGFLIHLFSIGYMEHEEDYARFFACMNFFIFAMLLLVLAGDLVVLFIGWEGVGLASYLLIGFWYQRPAAAKAATKAFVVNRIGDCGFLLALLLTFHLFGTSHIGQVIQQATQHFPVGTPVITLLTLLYFIGAIGKSAQLPLHTWLPDAMEGPTPVSALIHAATMVTAGVYLIIRLHPLFLLAPTTLQVIGIIGGITTLFAAICAAGQTDLKKVLAYSTVSQLGLMFLACGAGAFYAAICHLTTHAFMKSLLFLSAGNVVHLLHGTTEMSKMGGLAKKFPVTQILFLIGTLAMAGVPPLAAFFTKDLILEVEHLAGYETLFYMALAASILTAFYLMRAYCLTFRGTCHLSEENLKQAKEAPKIMLYPLYILALFSIGGGLLGFCFSCQRPLLEIFLSELTITTIEQDLSHHLAFSWDMLLAVGGSLVGIGSSFILYTAFADSLKPPLKLIKKAFFIDELYLKVFAMPLKALSSLINTILEPKIIEGSVQTLTFTMQRTAKKLQIIQSGYIRSYVAWMLLGLAGALFYFIL